MILYREVFWYTIGRHTGKVYAVLHCIRRRSMDFKKLYIDGRWVEGVSGKFIGVENPATETVFAEVPAGTAMDVDRAAKAAKAAFAAWAHTPLSERIEKMRTMATIFKTMETALTTAIVQELGAPVGFSRTAQVQYQFERIQSYIELAATVRWVEKLPHATVYREPVGVVGCITPWNYPLGQIVQKVIPAILAGNTVVLKPSQHTPLTAFYLAEAFHRAQFPKGVFNLVTGRGGDIGDVMAEHEDLQMISFTGSTPAGVSVARLALQSMKRISMELGGKSPCILLPGCDYEKAIAMCFNSIFLNSGQTCTALSRLLIPVQDKEKIEALLKKTVSLYTVGDPTREDVQLGTVSSARQFKTIRAYIEKGLRGGADLLVGEIPQKTSVGYYVQPTIFTNVTNDMTIAQEEIFGPVLCVITYRTEAEAVRIANDTRFGLSGAVWGATKEEAVRIARQIRTGNVYINDGPRDVTAPFGGFKESGLGREGGVDGILEFTEPQALFDDGTIG